MPEPTVQVPVSLLRDIVYTPPEVTGWLGRAAALLPQTSHGAVATRVAAPTDREVATAANCIGVLRHAARTYLGDDLGDIEVAALERVLSFARAHQTEDEHWEPV